MMKRFLKVAMLLCMVTLSVLFSTASLKITEAKAQVPLSGGCSACVSLNGVAAVSAKDVWAVGMNNSQQTLIENWNGKQWSNVANPIPGSTNSTLMGVAAVSATNIWAVGAYTSNSYNQTLIEQWDGTTWSVVPSPNVGSFTNQLVGVSVVSANDVWAVGDNSNDGQTDQTLIEHWDGTQWSIITSPNPGSSFYFFQGVAAVSASDVWTVGEYATNGGLTYQALIEHWDGTQWSIVTSSNPGPQFNNLRGVAVVSANDVWAVGEYANKKGKLQTLTEHWNGTQWSFVTSASPGSSGNDLYGVAAVSTDDVWAVGVLDNSKYPNGRTLIEHWNGTSWKVVSSPDPKGNLMISLNGVAVVSSGDVWTVGDFYNFQSNTGYTLIENWNGAKWKIVFSPDIGTRLQSRN